MASNNSTNHNEVPIVESEYDYAGLDLDKESQDEDVYDDVASVSTTSKPPVQPMGIEESTRKTGKLKG